MTHSLPERLVTLNILLSYSENFSFFATTFLNFAVSVFCQTSSESVVIGRIGLFFLKGSTCPSNLDKRTFAGDKLIFFTFFPRRLIWRNGARRVTNAVGKSLSGLAMPLSGTGWGIRLMDIDLRWRAHLGIR